MRASASLKRQKIMTQNGAPIGHSIDDSSHRANRESGTSGLAKADPFCSVLKSFFKPFGQGYPQPEASSLVHFRASSSRQSCSRHRPLVTFERPAVRHLRLA